MSAAVVPEAAAAAPAKTDVSAPLYRFFLADAQTAVRAGDLDRALECLGLALDFVPDVHRERALLEASTFLPGVGVQAGVGATAPREPVATAIEIIDDLPPLERMTWEPVSLGAPSLTATPVTYGPAAPAGVPAGSGVPAKSSPAPARSKGRVGITLAVAALAAAACSVVMMRSGRMAAPGFVPSVLVGTPVERARAALARGDGDAALARLDALGSDLGDGEAYLVRGEAEMVLLDSAGAVRSFLEAAKRDPGDGALALRAGDRLMEMGRDTIAADAYLHAASPERSREETERIAMAQERVGYASRARRIRAGGLE